MSGTKIISQGDWLTLGAVAPKLLVEARLQAHFAAQVVSGFGRTFLAKQDDDSHTGLIWNSVAGGLRSRALSAWDDLSAELHFAPFQLTLDDNSQKPVSSWLPLGRTVSDGDAWLSVAVAGARSQEPSPIAPCTTRCRRIR